MRLTTEEAYVAAFHDVRTAVAEADAFKDSVPECDYVQLVWDNLVRLWGERIMAGQLPPLEYAPHMELTAQETASVFAEPTPAEVH